MLRALLLARLKLIAKEELEITNGELAFSGEWVPDRWFRIARDRGRGFMARCQFDHVSDTFIDHEEDGLICFECFSSVMWTFPEDKTGSLEENWQEVRKTLKRGSSD